MRVALAPLLACVLLPGVAGAGQDTATGRLSAIPVGTQVRVVTITGQELIGPVVSATANGLVLEMPLARRVVPVGDVVRVEKRDSLANGGVFGAVVGAGLMVPSVVLCGEDGGSVGPACALPPLLFGAGIGALVGIGVDALIGHQVLYTASASRGRQPRLAPIVSASAVGVGGVITWR